jgi:hypothetical protein
MICHLIKVDFRKGSFRFGTSNTTFIIKCNNNRIYRKKRGDGSMMFRSKIDGVFITCLSIAILIIAAVTLLPPLLDKEASITVVMIMVAIFLISVSFLLWTTFSIKYIFYEDYLFVKGGPFRSKIAYPSITKMTPMNDLFTGYRILSSKEGLELFYQSATLGSVKISPKNRDEFISELKKRCPNIEI